MLCCVDGGVDPGAGDAVGAGTEHGTAAQVRRLAQTTRARVGCHPCQLVLLLLHRRHPSHRRRPGWTNYSTPTSHHTSTLLCVVLGDMHGVVCVVFQTTYRQCLHDNNATSLQHSNTSLQQQQRSVRSLSAGEGASTSTVTPAPAANWTSSSSAPVPTGAPSPAPPPPPHPCETPITDVDVQVIKALWLVVYWSSFCLTWLVLSHPHTHTLT